MREHANRMIATAARGRRTCGAVIAAVAAITGCGGAMPAGTAALPSAAKSCPSSTAKEGAAPATQGGPPIDAAAIPPGQGWSCFSIATGALLCNRTQGECKERRDGLVQSGGEGSECTAKPSVWCYSTQDAASCNVALVCFDGTDAGKDQCLKSQTAPLPGMSGCANLP